jgi:hypothetical protein
MEQRRQQAIQQKQQQEQQRAAVLAEKQRLLAGKLGKAGAAGIGSLGAAGARPGAGSAAAAAGPGRGPVGQPQRNGAAGAAVGVGSRGPGGLSSSAAGGQRQPTPPQKQQQQQQQQQQAKDPYAGLNPKVSNAWFRSNATVDSVALVCVLLGANDCMCCDSSMLLWQLQLAVLSALLGAYWHCLLHFAARLLMYV